MFAAIWPSNTIARIVAKPRPRKRRRRRSRLENWPSLLKLAALLTDPEHELTLMSSGVANSVIRRPEAGQETTPISIPATSRPRTSSKEVAGRNDLLSDPEKRWCLRRRRSLGCGNRRRLSADYAQEGGHPCAGRDRRLREGGPSVRQLLRRSASAPPAWRWSTITNGRLISSTRAPTRGHYPAEAEHNRGVQAETLRLRGKGAPVWGRELLVGARAVSRSGHRGRRRHPARSAGHREGGRAGGGSETRTTDGQRHAEIPKRSNTVMCCAWQGREDAPAARATNGSGSTTMPDRGGAAIC